MDYKKEEKRQGTELFTYGAQTSNSGTAVVAGAYRTEDNKRVMLVATDKGNLELVVINGKLTLRGV